MATFTKTTPFRCAVQPCRQGGRSAQRGSLVCRAQAEEAGFQKNVAVRLLAAGLAATALVAAPSIADAKVILEQPKVKKVFQGQSKPEAAPDSSSSSGGGGGGLSLPSISGPNLSGLNITPSDGLNPRAVALPGAILGIAGAGFAAFRLDSGFRDMMREGLVKDSQGFAGYEDEIKGDKYSAYTYAALNNGGTKKIAKPIKAKPKSQAKGKGKAKAGIFGVRK